MDITPGRPTTLQGYSSRDGLATDVCDRLAGRAVVQDYGTTSPSIVSADLIGLDVTSVQRIRKLAENRCDVLGRNVMIACSHTHSGPDVQRMAGSPPDEEYLEWVEGKLADAIVTASRVMRPVRLSAGHVHADFNVNRRKHTSDGVVMHPNPAGDVDNRRSYGLTQ